VVITDMLMPGKEGVETIVEIRRNFHPSKIIAISGHTREQALYPADGGKSRRAPDDGQAISMAEIIDAVEEILAKVKFRAALSAIPATSQPCRAGRCADAPGLPTGRPETLLREDFLHRVDEFQPLKMAWPSSGARDFFRIRRISSLSRVCRPRWP